MEHSKYEIRRFTTPKKQKKKRFFVAKITLGDVDVNRSGFCVRSWACVISRICLVGVCYGQTTLSRMSWYCFYANSTPWSVVIYHITVVVPEHVLGRSGTLKKLVWIKRSLKKIIFSERSQKGDSADVSFKMYRFLSIIVFV